MLIVHAGGVNASEECPFNIFSFCPLIRLNGIASKGGMERRARCICCGGSGRRPSGAAEKLLKKMWKRRGRQGQLHKVVLTNIEVLLV